MSIGDWVNRYIHRPENQVFCIIDDTENQASFLRHLKYELWDVPILSKNAYEKLH